MYPIVGRRWQCLDCPERVGFDLCGACYDRRANVVGRFNQHHTSGACGMLPHAALAQLPSRGTFLFSGPVFSWCVLALSGFRVRQVMFTG